MLLVMLNGSRGQAHILSRNKFLKRADGGHSLETIFTHKPPELEIVHFKRVAAPQHSPVMAVAVCAALRVSPSVNGSGGCHLPRVIFFNDLPERRSEQPAVTVPDGIGVFYGIIILLLPAPVVPTFVYLVVDAPVHQACMIAQPYDV